MGSLRNPVGPLPSSIYWRRRAVLVSVVALLALLITWIVTMGGGGGKDGDNGANGKNPAPTIEPGPSSSGPAISQAPGGRDESGGGGSDGSSPGSGDGSGDGDGSADGGGSGGGSGDGSGGAAGPGGSGGAGGSGSGGTVGGVGAGDTLPAGSSLPNCTASVVKFSLRSRHNTYAPEQTPTFLLTARNVSGSDCKIDLGPKNAVFAVTPAGGDDDYWSSADCPKAAAHQLFRVPAGSDITYVVKWNRKPSAPECATPPAGSAKTGTYLVEAKAPGFAKVQTSFVLSAD
ncbi:hypothetical protein [Streptomyces sp. NPDC015242]|uniref:hypothetical protein n=1 Tax=Streptomyces sp. NPDC015242 TaxID=3364951 RepID=UPI0037018A58